MYLERGRQVSQPTRFARLGAAIGHLATGRAADDITVAIAISIVSILTSVLEGGEQGDGAEGEARCDVMQAIRRGAAMLLHLFLLPMLLREVILDHLAKSLVFVVAGTHDE